MSLPLRHYHIEFNTFSTWLPGDPRGFRDHDHRIHSSGDYRNPPPPHEHQALHVAVQSRLHKPPVHLARPLRQAVGECLRDSLRARQLRVHAIAVFSNHAHVLVSGTVDDTSLRKVVGNAKRKSSHLLRNEIPGSLWQRKIGVYPVHDESHFANVMRYITAHADQGAWVWRDHDSTD